MATIAALDQGSPLSSCFPIGRALSPFGNNIERNRFDARNALLFVALPVALRMAEKMIKLSKGICPCIDWYV